MRRTERKSGSASLLLGTGLIALSILEIIGSYAADKGRLTRITPSSGGDLIGYFSSRLATFGSACSAAQNTWMFNFVNAMAAELFLVRFERCSGKSRSFAGCCAFW